MTLLAMSLALVAAATLGVVLGVRFAGWLWTRRAWKALERMLDDPKNRNALSVVWAYDQVQRVLEGGGNLDDVRKHLEAYNERAGELAVDMMMTAIAKVPEE